MFNENWETLCINSAKFGIFIYVVRNNTDYCRYADSGEVVFLLEELGLLHTEVPSLDIVRKIISLKLKDPFIAVRSFTARKCYRIKNE